MRLTSLLAVAAILSAGLTLTAHADTYTTFDISGSFDPSQGPGGGFSGTMTLDSTTGSFTDSTITVDQGGDLYTFTGDDDTSSTGPIDNIYGVIWYQEYVGTLVLQLPVSTLVGYTGGAI